jgi:signal transduction histidine kinase
VSLADNPLVRAVARVPASIHRKLLVAYFGMLVILVVLGVLGLQVLGASNGRVVSLGMLQQRITTYQEAQSGAAQVRQLLALRGSTEIDPGAKIAVPSSGVVTFSDSSIQSTMDGLGPLTDAGQLGFAPSSAERPILGALHSDYELVQASMRRIIALDQAGKVAETQQLELTAEQESYTLEGSADSLVFTAQAEAVNLIAQNADAYAGSQHLFIGVAAGSIVLVLVAGFALSWAIIGPVRRVSNRMEAIATGDFSAHVTLPNRDELGALAVNLNRMNDELARLYRELESASRHKSEFLASMSHELRTPLNAIIGFSQVLKERMFGDLNSKQDEYLDDVLSSGQHLLSLINDVLDIAKVEAGSMDLQLSVFSLPVSFDTALAMVRERATRHGIRLIKEIDPAVELVEADERKLKQILFNLLSNAVKFTPHGGKVTLAASMTDAGVTISVADTGVGISAEDQVLIFEEFYQAGPGRNQEGTGLGLPLTRKLVELHGGELWVRSVMGEGSTFGFTLPVAQPAIPEPAQVVPGEAVSA